MNTKQAEAKARIIDGQLVYNTTLTVQFAILAKGLGEAKASLRKMAQKNGGLEEMDRILNGPLIVPFSELDRYGQLLDIVRLIGRAAGEELHRVNYEGEHEHLFQCFHQGLLSVQEEHPFAGGTLEALFYDLGVHASSVMGITLREDADKQEVSMLIDNTRDAFMNGVMSEPE